MKQVGEQNLTHYVINVFVVDKDAMKIGTSAFNMAASEQYKHMGDEERKLLEASIPDKTEKTLTIKKIKKFMVSVCPYGFLFITSLHLGELMRPLLATYTGRKNKFPPTYG